MYNLRYHLITVVSIFLALAIGLLMGAAIGGSETLRQTSSSMVENLRTDYNKVVAERDELTGKMSKQTKFTSDFVNAWAHERLFQKTVVVLRDKESTSCAERIDDLVKIADGKVVQVTLAPLDFKDEKNADIIKELSHMVGENDPAKLRTAVAQRLAAEWAAGALGTASTDDPVKALIVEKTEAEVQKQTESEVQAKEQAGAEESPLSAEDIAEEKADTEAADADEALPTNEESGVETAPVDEEVRTLTNYLVEKKILTIGGNNEGLAKMDALVNIAVQSDNKPDLFALEITAAALNLKVPAAVTQFGNADDELLIEAQTRGFSGMAAVDSQIGGYGILALITGATGGTYGLDGMKAYPPIPLGSSFNATVLPEGVSIDDAKKPQEEGSPEGEGESAPTEPPAGS